MLTLKDLHEGDIITWNTVNKPAKGFVMEEDGELVIFMTGGGSFRAADIVTGSNAGVKIVGKARVKG